MWTGGETIAVGIMNEKNGAIILLKGGKNNEKQIQ